MKHTLKPGGFPFDGVVKDDHSENDVAGGGAAVVLGAAEGIPKGLSGPAQGQGRGLKKTRKKKRRK